MGRDLTGELLSSRYRIVSRLAGGGMGEVFRGHDALLDRPVAVKVLQPVLAGDQAFVARFREEARAAARLAHPNVVAVHDWGSEEGLYYMVMELVSGTDLRDLISTQGALHPAHAAEVVAAVCDALAAAHSSGLVHRDVKPENVLIARGGIVKVADFGIAAAAGRSLPGATGLGTVRYMSPEQARGADAGPASDLWAAGAVLYELLTGRPIQTGTGPDLFVRRATEPPPVPSEQVDGIPSSLDDVVLAACALDPSRRFADAAEMAAVLRAELRANPAPAPLDHLVVDVTGEVRPAGSEPTAFEADVRPKRSSWRRTVVAAAVIALVLGGARGFAALVSPGRVRVPVVLGRERVPAFDLLRDAGLEPRVVGKTHSWTVPRGRVAAQEPRAGEVGEGTEIELRLSAGPPPVELPDLVGTPEAVAVVRVRARGSDAEIRRRFDAAAPGTVVAHDPRAGPMRFGRTVTIVVSRGPRPVPLPAVAGMRPKEARAAVTAAGFKPVLVEAYSEEVAPGIVIGTRPSGETAPEGTEVEILVSIGPEFEEVTMPDVRGMSVDAATARLEGMGLRVQVRQSCGGSGSIVADTDPLSGTKIRENDLVVLFVC